MTSAGSRIVKTRLVRLNLILVAVLAATALYRFSGTFRNKVSRIKIESDFDISEFDIYTMAGFDSHNLLNTAPDVNELKQTLESIPEVRKAYVEKQFPETLRLVVYQRQPVGMCLYESEGESRICLFDKTGLIFKEAGDDDNWNLPVISGLPNDIMSPGNSLGQKLMPLVSDLAELKEESPALFNIISEINIVSGDNDSFRTVVSYVPYRIKAVMGSRLMKTELKQTLIILDEMTINGMDLTLDEIDFRSGEAVYAIPGGQV